MERVWLSSTYYLDPAIMGLSDGAEALFLRSIAFCGAAETRGFLPTKALKIIGKSSVLRRVQELLESELWVETEGGWTLKGWAKWQKTGDELLERREVDRQRKARQRASVRGQSRDQSRDKSQMSRGRIEENREEDEKSVSKSSSVSTATEPEETPRGPSVNVDAWKIVRDVIPSEHPQASKTELALQAGAMLKSGTTPADVRAALSLWLTKPNLGPRTLPSLVSEVIRNRDHHTRPRAPTRREQTFLEAESLKDNPNLDVLQHFPSAQKAISNGT